MTTRKRLFHQRPDATTDLRRHHAIYNNITHASITDSPPQTLNAYARLRIPKYNINFQSDGSLARTRIYIRMYI